MARAWHGLRRPPPRSPRRSQVPRGDQGGTAEASTDCRRRRRTRRTWPDEPWRAHEPSTGGPSVPLRRSCGFACWPRARRRSRTGWDPLGTVLQGAVAGVESAGPAGAAGASLLSHLRLSSVPGTSLSVPDVALEVCRRASGAGHTVIRSRTSGRRRTLGLPPPRQRLAGPTASRWSRIGRKRSTRAWRSRCVGPPHSGAMGWDSDGDRGRTPLSLPASRNVGRQRARRINELRSRILIWPRHSATDPACSSLRSTRFTVALVVPAIPARSSCVSGTVSP